jgi:hypothetical protein
MFRALCCTALLAGATALAQSEAPAAEPETSEQQKCQARCTAPTAECMMPCINGKPDEANKPDARAKTLACVKKCSDTQAACLKGCEKTKKTP